MVVARNQMRTGFLRDVNGVTLQFVELRGGIVTVLISSWRQEFVTFAGLNIPHTAFCVGSQLMQSAMFVTNSLV